MMYEMKAIGQVRNAHSERKDVGWGTDISDIVLLEEYKGGLKGLEDFSHAIIVYYLHEARFDATKHLQRRPQNREDLPCVGIFSQRGKDRPNQIGMTTVEIVNVSEGQLTVKGLDAIANTPILDIKPYYPMYDLKEQATVPTWVMELMKNYF